MKESILVAALNDGFSIVPEPPTSVGVVQAVVGFQPDEHDARAGRHVTIVRHVNEKFLEFFILDPLMKGFYEPFRRDGQIPMHEELDVYVLKIH